MEKQDTRKLSKSAKEALRQKVVRAVIDKKMKQREAAKVFEVSENSVSTWIRAYKEHGEDTLKIKPLGRPKKKALTEKQATSIRKSILSKTPDSLNLPGLLWTRSLVADLIECRFKKRLSRWTVGRYMKDWGLTVQKPAKRALEQDSKKVRYWLKTKYPAICRKAKKEKALIWWADETGLRSDHQTGTTWGEKGKTPILKQSGKRFSCNMISAITNQGHMKFMVFEERFNSKIFLEFLRRMVSQRKQKIFLILDNYSVHTSKKVQEWFLDNKKAIRVFFLPTYSPELNPDELLNQDLKSNTLRQKKPRTKDELLKLTRSFLRRKQLYPKKIAKYFEKKEVRYAMAN